jgi:heat shock protein HtpX
MFCMTAILLLVIPATYRWWDGRRVRRRGDDAALAERWTAHVGRGTKVTLLCMLMFPMLCPEWAIPGMLGVVLFSRAAGYPTRRALFGETWSLAGYLEWSVRLFVAMAGFWTLLAWTPYLVDLAGRHWLPVACMLVVTLCAWHQRFPQVLLRTIRATPLDPGAIAREFADGVDRVVHSSSAPRPTLWRAGPPGGVVANALALPSFRGPAVLFSQTLLESLSPSEATAIFAHEVAHLEHYDQRRLRRVTTVTLVLVAAAAASAPIAAWVAPGKTWVAVTMWPVAVVAAMALRARHSQQHETASDRRAIELCGDPEALASALVKLHTLARLPRRWSPDMEQRASHPSLAKRLRDIRARTGSAPPLPAAPIVVRSVDRGVWITIEADRVRYLSGVPEGISENVSDLVAAAASAIALPYEDVTDLRVISKGESCQLQIVDRDGRKLRCALQEGDIRRVQTALDDVDLKLPTRATAPTDPLTRTVVVLTALAAILTGYIGHAASLVGVVGLALIRMTPAALAGLATGSGAAAVTFLVNDTGSSSRLAACAALLVCAVLLWRAWNWRQTSAGLAEPRWRQLLLAIGTLCAWIAVTLISNNLLMLHRLVGELPAAAILPAALAGNLWMAAQRTRWSGAIMSLLAAVPLVIASPWFAYRFIGDPFLERAPAFAARMVQLDPITATDVPNDASSLQLSLGATRFIVGIEDYEDGGWTRDDRRFLLGDFANHRKEIVALDAAFIDASRAIVLSRAGGRLMLSLDSATPGEQPAWQMFLEIPGAADLEADAASGRWQVSSRTADRLFSVEGTLGAISNRREWPIPMWLRARQWVGTATGEAFGWGIDYQHRRLDVLPLLLTTGISGIPFWPARFDVLNGSGSRTLGGTLQEAQCQAGVLGAPISCFLTDGQTTRVWSFGGKRFDLVGSIDGEFTPGSGGSASTYIGWIGPRAAIVDLERKEIAWLVPPGASFAYEWDIESKVLGAIVDNGDTMRVATFRYR